jgi:hypothetical protein
MPKIALRYTGDDESLTKKLEATDGLQYFEPIDAREVLSTPGCDYEIDEESRKLIGLQFDPRLFGGKPGDAGSSEDEGKVNVPQLQGDDAELQTGLSAEKYGRSQVVKAVPDASTPTAMRPMTTSGRSLDLDEAQSGKGAGSGDPRMGFQQAKEEDTGQGGRASEGKTADEMREALKAKGVQFPPDAKKAELAELVDRHNAR